MASEVVDPPGVPKDSEAEGVENVGAAVAEVSPAVAVGVVLEATAPVGVKITLLRTSVNRYAVCASTRSHFPQS